MVFNVIGDVLDTETISELLEVLLCKYIHRDDQSRVNVYHASYLSELMRGKNVSPVLREILVTELMENNVMFKLGDKDDEIKEIQIQLRSKGYYKGNIDGDFGPLTEKAVVRFQKEHDLVVDGIFGPKTHYTLYTLCSGSKQEQKYLSEKDLVNAANSLGIELNLMKALNRIESRGTGFLPGNGPVILFERHWFYRLYKKVHGEERANKTATYYPSICNPKRGGYKGGEEEWHRFNAAQTLDQSCAIESCSWGLYQLMGFHWETLGYESPLDFFQRMSRSEADQLDGIVRFIMNNKELHRAMKDKNWSEIARLYNGEAYEENEYDKKLINAYEHFESLKE